VGAKPDEIVHRIDRQRDRLTDNLHELENRFLEATDWRVQYDRHPWAMLGAVFGGGVLLGAWLGGGSKDGAPEAAHGEGTKRAHSQLAEAIRGALITLAVNQLKNYISERAAQQDHTASREPA